MKYYKILFVIFALFSLMVPLFYMDIAHISEQENRTLATFPKVKKNNKLNLSYGKDFEMWLGDRFWGRDLLIDIRFQAIYKINGCMENEKAFIGEDGWMFEKVRLKNEGTVAKQYKKIEKDVDILKKFANQFKGKNVSIYLVMVPEREVLYQKYWEKYFRPMPRIDYAEELQKRLSEDTSIKVIYPKKQFEQISNIPYFYKEDIHLNGYGTQLLARTVLEFMGIDDRGFVVDEMPKNKKNFNIARQLGFRRNPYEGKEKKLSVTHMMAKYEKQEEAPDGLDQNNLYEVGISTHPVKDEKLYIIGVCYSLDALFPFLKYAYSETERITVWPIDEARIDFYNFRLAKLKKIYSNKEKFTIVIILSNFPGQEIRIIEDSLADF